MALLQMISRSSHSEVSGSKAELVTLLLHSKFLRPHRLPPQKRPPTCLVAIIAQQTSKRIQNLQVAHCCTLMHLVAPCCTMLHFCVVFCWDRYHSTGQGVQQHDSRDLANCSQQRLRRQFRRQEKSFGALLLDTHVLSAPIQAQMFCQLMSQHGFQSDMRYVKNAERMKFLL